MVTFIGAGPGAADLITLRGAAALQKADIVIYAGSLVNPELLELCPKQCRIHNSATMTLDEVMDVILQGHREDKNIVRLHTGDPSLYGAIGEQMALLRKHGIEFDVIPGVSAFQAAAAALKTEYTLPEIAQTVIITRAEGRTPVPEKERLQELAAHQSTMVLFLSATLAEKVRQDLLDGGYASDTPAAVVYRASWPDEKVIRCTLDRIPEVFRENGTAPALIIVGKVLSDENVQAVKSRLYAPDFSTGYREAKS